MHQLGHCRYSHSACPACPALPCRFLGDRVHEKQLLLEKLELRFRTVRATVAKLEAQLAHEAEVGGSCSAAGLTRL